MRTSNRKYTGVVGEVIEFNPPHRFSHTFKFTQYDDPPCTVTYDLVQVEDGVEFTMTCDSISAGSRTAKQMKQGGPTIIKVLKAMVENGKMPFAVRVMYGLFKLLEPLTPRVSRSENWPIDRAA
jgi:uncharacterized protein YndB with AHSA1/START domain